MVDSTPDCATSTARRGRLYHAAFEAGDGLHVFDVWESMEAFAGFGAPGAPA